MNIPEQEIDLIKDFGFPESLVFGDSFINFEYKECDMFPGHQVFIIEDEGDIRYAPVFGFNMHGNIAPPNRTERYIGFRDSSFVDILTRNVLEILLEGGRIFKANKIIISYSRAHLDRISMSTLYENDIPKDFCFPKKVDGYKNLVIKYENIPFGTVNYSLFWTPDKSITQFFGFDKNGNVVRSSDSETVSFSSPEFKILLEKSIKKCVKEICQNKNDKIKLTVVFSNETDREVFFICKRYSDFEKNIGEVVDILKFPKVSFDGIKVEYKETPLYVANRAGEECCLFETPDEHIVPFGFNSEGLMSDKNQINFRKKEFRDGLIALINEYSKQLKDKFFSEKFNIIVHYSKESQFLIGLSCSFKKD